MKTVFATLFVVMSAVIARGDDPPVIDPPELAAMRDDYLRSIQRVSIPVIGGYIRQLEAQKVAFTRAGKPDAALAVDKELKEVTKQLQAANAAADRSGARLQLLILQASYEDTKKKRSVEITKNLRKLLESGEDGITLNTRDGAAGMDPAPYVPKQTTISYSINGQRKQKVFPEGYQLNFKNDLN